ncbi:MAG: iron-containing alcohol dehydrogenase [Treponema sp.]|nr:iron-containing alcohol dehydrogenase [Treponema sp.]
MADFFFRVSPNIVLGSYTVSRLGYYASEMGTKFMLVLDPILRDVGLAEKVTKSLEDHKIDFFTFDAVKGSATTELLEQALTLARDAHVQGVIGVGGTQVLNLAKIVCELFHEKRYVYDFVEGEVPSTEPLPLICVPTTIRNPYIFSNFTSIVDSRSNSTKIIKNKNAICKLALFDPNLTVSLSENQICSMSLEVLCLATEAYLSPKASFFSDMVAEKAIELTGYSLDGAPSLMVTTPSEVLLSQGGCMAGLASATSSQGAATLLALSTYTKYGISQSLVTSILFPYIIEDHAKFKGERIARLAKILRVAKEEMSVDEACAAYADNIRQRIAKANLPARLKDLQVSIEQLSLATEDAGQLEMVNFLPRSMTSDDLFNLVKLAY